MIVYHLSIGIIGHSSQNDHSSDRKNLSWQEMGMTAYQLSAFPRRCSHPAVTECQINATFLAEMR
jgi:hypothetical protein